MKSVLFRAFLMVLVVLPLGTFRTLHALLRTTAFPIVRSAEDLIRSVPSPRAADGFVGEGTSETPGGKLRFRNWADVTFLASESPQVCGAWVDAIPAPVILEAPEPLSAPSEFLSPLQAHRTPREALIAARTLVI